MYLHMYVCCNDVDRKFVCVRYAHANAKCRSHVYTCYVEHVKSNGAFVVESQSTLLERISE